MFKLPSLTVALTTILVMATTQTVRATVLNGNFETGNFSNWVTAGQFTVENSSFGVTPTDGNYQAVLETVNGSTGVSGSELEIFLGLAPGSLGVVEGSAIKQAINVDAGDVLTFDWNFLTDQDPDLSYNDFAFFTLSNTNQLADTNAVFTTFPSFSRLSKETGYKSYFSAPIQVAGTYTLGFGVFDMGDDTVNSALLVDNIKLTKKTVDVPEPSTIFSMGIALGLGAFFNKKQEIKEKSK